MSFFGGIFDKIPKSGEREESQFFQPPIEIDVVKVKHAEGQDWGFAPGWLDLDAKSLTATCFEADCYDANLYVFLTGSTANLTVLGVGSQGVVCRYSYAPTL